MTQQPHEPAVHLPDDNFPDESIAGVPADGAAQHDHYLYGAPKREANQWSRNE